MPAAFDPKMIDVFDKAIALRNPEMLKQALAGGVDPATPTAQGAHPLGTLLFTSYAQWARLNPAAAKDVTADRFNQNTSALIDALLEKNIQLVEPEKYETQDYLYLIDRLLRSTRYADLSTVMLHAIGQSLEQQGYAWRPDVDRFVAATISLHEASGVKVDYTECIASALNTLETMHNIVSLRLEEPQTEREKRIVSQYNDKIDYWMRPFERPPLWAFLEGQGAFQNPEPAAKAPPVKDQVKEGFQAAAQAEEDKFAKLMARFITKLEKKPAVRILKEMDEEFIGLDNLKTDCRKMILRQQFAAARAVADLPDPPQSHSTVFLGPPGVGKTTGARKRAELLYSLGLTGPNYVEISRENLVGAYVGHTEKSMVALFNQADIVFIDEAYNLYDGRPDSNDFGKKVIDSLIIALENRRDSLTIFMAGYPDEMEAFLASNPGFKSRIVNYRTLDGMTLPQLEKVLEQRLAQTGLSIDDDAKELVMKGLKDAQTKLGPKAFGNAREVRKIVEKVPDQMAERLFGAKEGDGDHPVLSVDKKSLSRVTREDVEALDLEELLGGKGLAPVDDDPRIGFTAKLRPQNMR